MNIKEVAENQLKGACSLFLQDLEALPKDAFCKGFGGTTRTVADIVHEVNLVSDHVGMVIRNEEPFDWPEGWVVAPQDLNTKELVIEAFRTSSEKILATVGALSIEELESTVQTENGERSRFQRFQFLTNHLWYHSGQLNYIQTLLGDDGWHWK
jgi:hypothetical protein